MIQDLYGMGIYLFPLRSGTKEPLPGSRGHLDAVPAEDFVDLTGNYGIALEQSRLVLVDIDNPDAFNPDDFGIGVCPYTLGQKTRRGFHYFFRVPEGYKGTNRRVDWGDIKVNGYAVGPGSVVAGHTYELLWGATAILDAPKALLDYCAMPMDAVASDTSSDGSGKDYITSPGRDNELFRLGSYLRKEGYSRDFIAQTLANMPIEQPEGDPITSHDILRIARQASRYPVEGGDTLTFQSSALIPASDVDLVGRPIHWLVNDFIPKGELVMAYGASGIGKSTVGSWLAAQVTGAGKRFLFHGLEEPFERFALRAVLGGADRNSLFDYDNGGAFQFPRDAQKLKSIITTNRLDVVYFDSIYSNFEHSSENMATQARASLAPLAEVAQETGCAIIGVFHTNKDDGYMGSTEMKNVCRFFLKMSRSGEGPLVVRVEKTNYNMPDSMLAFGAEDKEARDPLTGRAQLSYAEDGTLLPIASMKVAVRQENIPVDSLSVDDVDSEAAERERRIIELLEANPGLSASAIYAEVGGRKADTLAFIKEAKDIYKDDVNTEQVERENLIYDLVEADLSRSANSIYQEVGGNRNWVLATVKVAKEQKQKTSTK